MWLVLVVGMMGCQRAGVRPLEPDDVKICRHVFPARPNRAVEILFVIGDSERMAGKQEALGRAFESFVGSLRDATGQPLDYRIAVASTDVGAGGYPIDPEGERCSDPRRGGVEQYRGVLQTTIHDDERDWEGSVVGRRACGDPARGVPPGDPALCEQLRASRRWLLENCQGLALLEDRPYVENSKELQRPDEDVARQLRCLAMLGVNGCFIEQPLEAARAALARNRDSFLRYESLLAVVFVTDEPDCSLADPALLDPDATDLGGGADPELRCALAARRCTGERRHDIADGDATVTVTGTTACEDDPRWLVPVDDYERFLRSGPGDYGSQGPVILAGLTGNLDYTQAPSPPLGPGPQSADLAFVWELRRPPPGAGEAITARASPSCDSPHGTARPAPRLHELLARFPDPEGAPTSHSICADDLAPALELVAHRIARARTAECVLLPDWTLEHDPDQVCVLQVRPYGWCSDEPLPPDLPSQGADGTRYWHLAPRSSYCPGTDEPGIVAAELELVAGPPPGTYVEVRCDRPIPGR